MMIHNALSKGSLTSPTKKWRNLLYGKARHFASVVALHLRIHLMMKGIDGTVHVLLRLSTAKILFSMGPNIQLSSHCIERDNYRIYIYIYTRIYAVSKLYEFKFNFTYSSFYPKKQKVEIVVMIIFFPIQISAFHYHSQKHMVRFCFHMHAWRPVWLGL